MYLFGRKSNPVGSPPSCYYPTNLLKGTSWAPGRSRPFHTIMYLFKNKHVKRHLMFLFNIYVNDMQQSVMENCNLIQYADDTMIFSSHNDLTEARNNLQQPIESLVNFFESHQLTINADKTEFICFCKPSKNDFDRNHTLKVENQIINKSTTVKYLGVYLENTLFIEISR